MRAAGPETPSRDQLPAPAQPMSPPAAARRSRKWPRDGHEQSKMPSWTTTVTTWRAATCRAQPMRTAASQAQLRDPLTLWNPKTLMCQFNFAPHSSIHTVHHTGRSATLRAGTDCFPLGQRFEPLENSNRSDTERTSLAPDTRRPDYPMPPQPAHSRRKDRRAPGRTTILG